MIFDFLVVDLEEGGEREYFQNTSSQFLENQNIEEENKDSKLIDFISLISGILNL